jgi:hypothetical protein
MGTVRRRDPLYHRRPKEVNPAAEDPELQDRLLDYRGEVSGVALG